MATPRRSVPLLKEVCTQVCRAPLRRPFHVSTPSQAKAMSPRSIRAKMARPAPAQTTKVRKTYTVDEMLPPIALVHTACKAGVIKSDLEDAMTFLQVYAEELDTQCLAQDKALVDNSTITPYEMAVMGMILNRCNTIPQKSLGKKLIVSACMLSDKSATFELVLSALRTKKLDENAIALYQLSVFAKKYGDPQAMFLLANVLRMVDGPKRNKDEALVWLQKATHPPTGNIEWAGASEALVEEGRMLLAEGAMLGARKAFEQAAFELDDPTAYFYLSKLEELGSEKQELYLNKACSAGILEAWHNLGVLEMTKDRDRISPTKLKHYGMAREWFLVAAAEGFGLSMLNLAIMHKNVGDLDGAMTWLEKAEEAEGVADEAKKVRRQWETEMMAQVAVQG